MWFELKYLLVGLEALGGLNYVRRIWYARMHKDFEPKKTRFTPRSTYTHYVDQCKRLNLASHSSFACKTDEVILWGLRMEIWVIVIPVKPRLQHLGVTVSFRLNYLTSLSWTAVFSSLKARENTSYYSIAQALDRTSFQCCLLQWSLVVIVNIFMCSQVLFLPLTICGWFKKKSS